MGEKIICFVLASLLCGWITSPTYAKAKGVQKNPDPTTNANYPDGFVISSYTGVKYRAYNPPEGGRTLFFNWTAAENEVFEKARAGHRYNCLEGASALAKAITKYPPCNGKPGYAGFDWRPYPISDLGGRDGEFPSGQILTKAKTLADKLNTQLPASNDTLEQAYAEYVANLETRDDTTVAAYDMNGNVSDEMLNKEGYKKTAQDDLTTGQSSDGFASPWVNSGMFVVKMLYNDLSIHRSKANVSETINACLMPYQIIGFLSRNIFGQQEDSNNKKKEDSVLTLGDMLFTGAMRAEDKTFNQSTDKTKEESLDDKNLYVNSSDSDAKTDTQKKNGFDPNDEVKKIIAYGGGGHAQFTFNGIPNTPNHIDDPNSTYLTEQEERSFGNATELPMEPKYISHSYVVLKIVDDHPRFTPKEAAANLAGKKKKK